MRKIHTHYFGDFLINIASAWFIAGLVSPFFTKTALTENFLFDILIALLNCALFLVLMIKVVK